MLYKYNIYYLKHSQKYVSQWVHVFILCLFSLALFGVEKDRERVLVVGRRKKQSDKQTRNTGEQLLAKKKPLSKHRNFFTIQENTPFWITHQRVFPRLLTNPEILSGCKLAKLYQMSGTLKSFKKLNKHSQFQMLNCFAYATLQAPLICYHPHVHKNPSRTRSLFTGFRRKMGFQASHLTEIGFTSAF